MEAVLQDFSAPSLVGAIKGNLFEFYRYLGRSSQAEFYEDEHLTWLLTGVPHSFLNSVIRTQLPPRGADGTIERTLDHFRSKNMHRLSWWNEPGSRPEDLGERLLAHGLSYTEGSPGMALDLSELGESGPTPEDFEACLVEDDRTLQQWISAFASGFGLEGQEAPSYRLFAGLGYGWPLRSHVGFLHGKPVATAQVFLGAGVAGIYCVATLKEAQRRGIAAKLVRDALSAARGLGYRIAILHSTSMGYSLYRRMGFREYCKMSQYCTA